MRTLAKIRTSFYLSFSSKKENNFEVSLSEAAAASDQVTFAKQFDLFLLHIVRSRFSKRCIAFSLAFCRFKSRSRMRFVASNCVFASVL